jgi:hydrophobe/amphiphile efflux-1 (HAE1) family protein
MNISAWAIRRPLPVIVLFIILTLAGIHAFLGLGVNETPNIDLPIVTVSVAQIGAAPSELETQVTRKVEDAIAGIGNIKHITSTVVEGTSTTTIEFELGTDTDRALNDVRDAVTRIRQQLPASITDPVIQRLDFAGGPLATYTVSSTTRSVEDLSWFIDNDISRALLSVPGVGQVQRSGGVDREIQINLDPTRLQALGLTANQVNTQIRALNINMPGGRGTVGGSEQSIRTLGSAETVAQLRAARIALPNGGWTRLEDIGKVIDTYAEPRQRALLDDRPVVAFQVIRSTGASLVAVGDAVDQQLAKLRKTLPPDMRIDKIRSNVPFVMESYTASFDSLELGALLAVIVIWLFLRDWRASLISALAMPLSIIPTFAAMKWLGFTLNNMSLLGLALVIGILVDDAIVEVENIVRHIHMGKKPYEAALEAADEIGMAVIATSATIIVVFVPVAFMGGIPGQFFKQFGLTVAMAVFFSLLVARLVTPLMSAHWLKKPPEEKGRSRVMALYERLMIASLHHRWVVVAVALAFFVFSGNLARKIPTELFADTDRGETVLSISLPPGATLDETTKAVIEADKIARKHPEVALTFATIGTPSTGRGMNAGGGGAVNSASLYIELKPRGERALSQQQLEQVLRPELRAVPGVRMSFGSAVGGPGSNIQIVLASDNDADLEKAGDALLADMRTIAGLEDVQSGAALRRPEIVVIPDVAKAAEQGVTIADIAQTAQIATLGDAEQNLAKFDLPGRQIDIRVQLEPKFRDQLDTIRRLQVPAEGNHLVPLMSVAKVEMSSGPSQIDRYDRMRRYAINASLAPGFTLGQAIKAVHAQPAYRSMPADVRELPSGNVEIQGEVFSGFAFSIASAILGIYLVLVLLFGEFLQPFTIMMSLPLSLGGALIALLMAGKPLGMYALIGIVMLMGLVTKNAILLVEYVLVAMARGVRRNEAILESGETRMRPIMMTTVAMVAGMVPIALGLGAGSEVRAPMAIAVVGGLISSTFLTLVVVPVVFTLVDDARSAVSRAFRGVRAVRRRRARG